MLMRDFIRPATPNDQQGIVSLANAIGFSDAEIHTLREMLEAYFAGSLGNGHQWIIAGENDVHGAAYYAPEMMTTGTWNLYFIAILPELQGKGHGSALLQAVEAALRACGERVLIVETSGLGAFARTRAFYRKHGFAEEARIREFYAAGDDKVVFWRALS